MTGLARAKAPIVSALVLRTRKENWGQRGATRASGTAKSSIKPSNFGKVRLKGAKAATQEGGGRKKYGFKTAPSQRSFKGGGGCRKYGRRLPSFWGTGQCTGPKRRDWADEKLFCKNCVPDAEMNTGSEKMGESFRAASEGRKRAACAEGSAGGKGRPCYQEETAVRLRPK